MTSTTFNDTQKRLRAMLAKDFKLDPGALTLKARLEDLGVDSLGMAELIFNVEDEFDLKLPDVAVTLSTFGEVVRYIDDAVAAQRAVATPSPLVQGVQTAT